MATHYGPVGAASVWIALNCCSMAISVPLMHRRLLKGEMVRWFTEDVGLALAAVFVVVGSARALIVSALLAGAFAAPQIRNLLLEKLSKIPLDYA
jgi:hypothetical protein